jgi:hypothetical protein
MVIITLELPLSTKHLTWFMTSNHYGMVYSSKYNLKVEENNWSICMTRHIKSPMDAD